MDKVVVSTPAGRRLLLTLPLLGVAWLLFAQKSGPRIDTRGIKEVGLEEARSLIAAAALIIDVREKAQYAARHLPGAILMPLSELSRSIPAYLAQSIAKPILVYCGDGVTHGPEGTAILNRAGYVGAVNLKPGIEGWASAGLPLEHGTPKAV